MYLYFTCLKLAYEVYFEAIDLYKIKFHIFFWKNTQFVNMLLKHFQMSRSNPVYREIFLGFPVLVPNYKIFFLPLPFRLPGKLFWFSRSRPKMQKVIPALAWILGGSRSFICTPMTLSVQERYQSCFYCQRGTFFFHSSTFHFYTVSESNVTFERFHLSLPDAIVSQLLVELPRI